jgi:hypothetical protein
MTRLLSALVALMLLAVPAGAGAQTPHTNAPAGNSAIDEYLETVPSVTGSNGPRPPGTGGGSATGALTTAQRKRLERAGPAGRQLASVVDAAAPVAAAPAPAPVATAPAPASGRRKSHKRTLAPPTAQGRSPVAEVLNAATGQGGGDDDGGGGGGMGVLLPAILLGSLLGVIALVAIRRRSVS